MSGEIKRTGPPSARDVKGRLITWTVPLNAMPDKEWRQFFLQTKDTTVTCTPNHVHVYQGMMVFESLEENVPTWISFRSSQRDILIALLSCRHWHSSHLRRRRIFRAGRRKKTTTVWS